MEDFEKNESTLETDLPEYKKKRAINKNQWKDGIAQIVVVNGVSWACCTRCSHKLGKINSYEALKESNVSIEIKCQSCKWINTVSNRSRLCADDKETSDAKEQE